MKVIGTGAPVVVTLTLDVCEVPLLREELELQCEVRLEHAETLRTRSFDPATTTAVELEVHQARIAAQHEEAVRLRRLLERFPASDELQARASVEVVAPMSSIWPAVRAATGEAIERFAQAHERLDFTRLVSAADTARALSQTLAELDYVASFGLTEGGDLDDIGTVVEA